MRRIVLILLVLCNVMIARAQSFAINTDVALLALQTYNIGADMTIGNRSTLGMSVFTVNQPYWHKGIRVTGAQPEYRYYFGGRPLYHHFVGLGLLAADYNFVQKGKRYDGYALGAGLTFGYVFG